MRRSVIFASILAVSTVILGACEQRSEPPRPPAASPTPAVVASPAASPSVSPTGSPAKPGTTPEVKKEDVKVNKDAKPAATETPKAK